MRKKTLAEKHKTPAAFEDNEKYEFAIKNVKEEKAESKPEKKEEELIIPTNFTKEDDPIPTDENKKDRMKTPEEKTQAIPQPKPDEQTVIDDADIMGSFDKDLSDGTIIIRENTEGRLIDLRGRTVNQHGYLIDGEGNVINRKGEIIFRKEEVTQAFGEETLSKPLLSQPQFQPPQPNPIEPSNIYSYYYQIGEEKKEDQTPEEKKEKQKEKEEGKDKDDMDSTSRKSVTFDALMEDTPSNYNFQNQRYEETLDNLKDRGSKALLGRPPPIKPKEIEYEEPSERDFKLAHAYGGKPRGKPKAPKKKRTKSKSVNRRNPDKIFKAPAKVSGYISDKETLNAFQKQTDVSAPENDKEESKEIKKKPLTARSVRAISEDRRAKSRRRDSKPMEDKEKDLENMFLHSDDEENSIASIAPSNKSNTKLTWLESNYLQRLESSKKHNTKKKRKEKIVKGPIDLRTDSQFGESGTEKDAIEMEIEKNYEEMQNHFSKSTQQVAEQNKERPKSKIIGTGKPNPTRIKKL